MGEAKVRKSRLGDAYGHPIDVSGGYDAAVEAAGGLANVVTVSAALGDGTVKAAVPIARINEFLAISNKTAASLDTRRTDPRQEAMAFVIGGIKRGDHMRQPSGSAIVGTLLWLACTKPEVGSVVKERALRGGSSIWWVITEGGPGFGNNWRLVLDGTPDDVADVPTPEHPHPGTPGGPPLNS
jgi:hypothetical protein